MTLNSRSHKNKYKKLSKKNHTKFFQDLVKDAFQVALVNSESITLEVKNNYFRLQKIKSLVNEKEKLIAIDKFYKEISINRKNLASLLELEAKLQDLLRRARKSAVNSIINCYKKQKLDPRYSLLALLNKLNQNNFSKEEVQEILFKSLKAIFSLTGHPTNPTGIEYTKLCYEFDAIIDENSSSSYEALHKVLKKIIKVEIANDKKTPIQEMQETEFALANIFTFQDIVRKNLQKEIDQSPYKNKIFIPPEIFEIAVWTHGGDADGNPNMNAEILEYGYKSLKNNNFPAKIDIRHDADEIIDCVQWIFEKFDIIKSDSKLNRIIWDNSSLESKSLQIKVFSKLIIDENKIQKITNLVNKTDQIPEIVKRLKICAKNYQQTDKFIIANTKGINHVLAVLFLLKITGNKTSQQGSNIDIVTLLESVEDLKKIFDLHQELLENSTYLEHIKHRGRIVVMIAKSDTVRVGGSGAEFYQDQASGKAFLLNKLIKEKYNLDIEIRVFNGGGFALQRGGGRIDEVALRHAKSLLSIAHQENWSNPCKGPSLMTIQGHQQQLLFSAGSCVINSLTNAITQNVHADLLVKGIINNTNEDFEFNEVRKKFCDKAIEAYQKKYFANKFLNQLFANANRAGVMLGNLSSRPLKRNDKNFKITAKISYEELCGKVTNNFDLFSTRAITLDRTVAHTGTFAIMFLSINEALVKHEFENLHNLYNHNKCFRDFIRNQIIALHMVDLDHAWRMLIGCIRPSKKELIDLAKNFSDYKILQKMPLTQQNKVTMAYIDRYINKLAKNIYQIFTGSNIAIKSLNLKKLLEIYSPDLANEMNYRDHEAIFVKFTESTIVNFFNNNKKTLLTSEDIKIIRHSYIATNVVFNAPVATLATLTTMKNHQSHEVKTLLQKIDENSLPLPKSLF